MQNILAWFPGPTEWIVIALVGLLLFGRRLPEVGRSLGKSIVEFKKGIRDVEDDVDMASRPAPRSALPKTDQRTALPQAGVSNGTGQTPGNPPAE